MYVPGQDCVFPVIKRERISDRIAEEIHRLIRTGRLSPGELLPGERRLAAMMKVSRASLRTALERLKAEGLIVTVHGGGTKVAPQPPAPRIASAGGRRSP